MVPTWFEIYRDKAGQILIYKMDANGKAIGAHPATNRVDAICHILLSEPTANTVLFADPAKPLPVVGGNDAAFSRKKLAAIAESEARKGLSWRGGGAKIYTKKYEPVFGKGRFSWCAAFVTWCADQAGLNLPVNCPTGYTFALCEAWQQWAIKAGFYHDNDGKFVPLNGDVVLFDWDQKYIDEKDTDWEDHIGIIIRDGSGSGLIVTAEGNVSDACQLKSRSVSLVQGFIRIPDGYKFA